MPPETTPLEATLASARIPAAVGAPTEVQVAVRNRAPVPVDVVVGTVGAEALGEVAPVGALAPGASTTLTVAMVVPDRYPGQVLTAAVELVAHRAGTSEELGRSILPVELVLDDGGLVTARLARRDLRGRRRARIRLVLDNQTPHPVEVRLGGDSPTGEVAVDLPGAPVTLDAGHGTVVEGHVRAPIRLWGGVSRHPFGILVSTRRGTQRLPGSFSHRPLFARGLVGGLGVLVAFALWASALVVGLDRLASRDSDGGDAEVAQLAGEGSDVDGGTGGAAGGGGGGGSGGGALPAPVVQVGGTVGGPAAAGVTVRLESVSLSDARQQGAQMTSTVRLVSHHRGLTKVVGPTARRDGAVPIASLRTQVEPIAPRAGALLTTTNEDGLWGFADVRAPGYYLLTFAKAGYQTSKQVIEATEDSKGIDLEVDLEAAEGSISGTVTGGGGPLGGAEVTVTDGVVTHATTTASAGPIGSYTLEGLSTPGSYLVSVSRPGYGREARLVELPASGTATGIDLDLRPGVAAISGTIVGADGPQGGVTVRVEGEELVREATTFTQGQEGRYILPQLPIPGSYTLHVEAEGWATETRAVDLRADTEVNLSLQRTTAQLSGTVTDQGRGGLSSAGVTLESDGGDVFRSVTADEGFYSMAGITPGSYVMRVERAGYAPAEHLVTLEAGESSSLDLSLPESEPDDIPATATVTGTITNDTPGPDRSGPDCTDDRVVGAEVEVVLATADPDIDPADLRTTANCEDGTFAVSGLPPGVHRIRASHPDFVPQELRVRVPVDGTAEASMALTPLASIVVHVFSDATGERLAGAGVAATIAPAQDPALVGRPDGALIRTRYFPSGGYDLTVRAPGHRSVTRSVTLVEGEELVTEVRLPRLGQLTVAVFDFLSGLDLTPAADQPVELLTPDGAPARDGAGELIAPNPRATGPDGTTRFTGLAGARPDAPDDGRYLVRVQRAGQETVTVPVTVTENVAVDDVGSVVLTTSQDHFAGRILWKRDLIDAGVANPRIQARVVVGTQRGPDGTPVLVTRTYEIQGDPDGRFAIDWANDLPPGSPVPISQVATLTVSAPGFVTRTLPDQRIDTGQFRAELVAQPGRITGTVTRQETPDASAAGPATATVTSSNGATVAVTVGAGGQITTNPVEVPAGTYHITYSLSGYDPTTVAVVVPPGGQADGSATIVKQGQVTVRARSLVGGGQVALPGANYQIERWAGGGYVPHESASGVAGDQHTFADLTHGTYRVRVTHPGHVRDGDQWQGVEVVIGATIQVDHLLRRLGSIEGSTVRSFQNGSPTDLTGAQVVLRRPGVGVPVASAISAGNGTFAFPGLDDGPYELVVTAAGHDDATVPVDLGIGEDLDLGEVVLATQPAELAGTVQDSRSQAPLVGVLVRLTAPDGTEETTQTAPDGTYSLEGLAPQPWQVSLSLNGYSPLQTSLNLFVAAGGVLPYSPKLVRIRNAIVGEVKGRFGPNTLSAIEGATVVIARPDGSPVPDLANDTYTTNAAGRFTIADLPTGSYQLHITAAGFHDPGARIVTVTETGNLNLVGPDAVVLEVIPVDVTVTVRSSVDHDGFDRPITTRPVELVAGAGSTGSSRPSQPTDATGQSSFAAVIPGAYTISVDPDATGARPGASQQLVVAVGADPVTATITISERGITGTVRIDRGQGGEEAVAGAQLSLRDADGVAVTSTTADLQGTYRFLVAPGEAWTVVPEQVPAGHTAVPDEVEVASGGSTVVTGADFLYRADPVTLSLSVTGPSEATFTVTGDGVNRSSQDGTAVAFTDVRPHWDLTVTITAAGYEDEVLVLTLDPGVDREVPTIAMAVEAPDPP